MQTEIVSRSRDRSQRVGIDFGIPPLDEECGSESSNAIEKRRCHLPRAVVIADGLALRPQAQFQLSGFPHVIERKADCARFAGGSP